MTYQYPLHQSQNLIFCCRLTFYSDCNIDFYRMPSSKPRSVTSSINMCKRVVLTNPTFTKQHLRHTVNHTWFNISNRNLTTPPISMLTVFATIHKLVMCNRTITAINNNRFITQQVSQSFQL